jgi:cytochrome c
MDSFEINKIVAAVLMVALLVIGIGKLSDVIFHVEKPETPGYAVDVEEATTVSSSTKASVEEKIDIDALMAMGDLTHGEKVFKKCAACHSIVKGGKNNIGPALYNVVGRQIGVVNDYKYSKALSGYGKEWTFEELNGYLIKPAKWIKGTKMAFAGLRKEKDRASVILYLNQNSDNPLPLP